MTLADLVRAKPEPPPSLLADRLLPVNGLALLAGRPGVGKTWAILDLALSVAAGAPWLGRIPTGTPRRVGLAPFELPSAYLWRRAEAVAAVRRFDSDVLARVSTLPPDAIGRASIDVLNPDHFAALLVWAEDFDLVILDALQRTHGQSENDADGIGPVLQAFDRLRTEAEVAVLLVHHERKMGEKATDDLDAVRGSSRLTSDPQLVVRLREERGLRQLRVAKANFGPTPEPVWLRATDAGPLEACEGPDEKGATRRRDEVLGFVRDADDWTAARRVAASLANTEFAVDVRTVRRDLEQLARRGQLSVMVGRNRMKLYRAPSESDVGRSTSDPRPTDANSPCSGALRASHEGRGLDAPSGGTDTAPP